jgi:diguanylate cyclase
MATLWGIALNIYRWKFVTFGHCKSGYHGGMNPVTKNRGQYAWLGTLKFKIAAMAAVAGFLSALTTADLLLGTTEENIQQVVMQGDIDGVQHTAELLASKVDVLKNTLRAVAQNTPPSLWAKPTGMERFLLDKPAAGTLFENVFATRPSGEMIARINNGKIATELPNIADRAYFQQALLTDQAVVSEPVISKVTNTPIIIIAIAVMGADGKVAGILAGSLALESNGLFSAAMRQTRADSSRTVVMGRSGILLAHPESARVMGRAVDEPGLSSTYLRWSDSGSPIDTNGSATLEGDFLVTMAGIPATDWVLSRITPLAIALQPVQTARSAAWRVALGIGLLAALLAAALAWYLTQPISRLQLRAERLLDDTSADAHEKWPTGSGEIGALSAAFAHVVATRQEKQAQTHALLLQLEAVLDHAQVGIALTRNGIFELVSQHFCHVFRTEKLRLVGQPTSMIHPNAEAYEALSARARPAFMKNSAFDGEVQLMRATGELFWAQMRGRAVVAGDRTQGTIWTVEDVTEAREQREQLSWDSSHDALTGLSNRSAFEILLAQATHNAKTEPFCTLFIDLDRFKQVNDTGGHAAGDALLKDIAKTLSAHVRQTDTAARFGGDEFAVLLHRCPLPKAMELAEKLCKAVAAYRLNWDGHSFGVGASIGLVHVDGRFAQAAEVLRAADAACYAAKNGGRNQVAVFSGAVPAPQ